MTERIAITGTGVLSAAGAGTGGLMDAMFAGLAFFSGTDLSGRSTPWPIAWSDPALAVWPDGPPWNGAKKYANTTARTAVTVASQVLERSGRQPEGAAYRGASVVAVSSSGGDELQEVMPKLAVKAQSDPRALAKFLYDEVPDYSYIRGIPSQMGQFVSMATGFRGSNLAVYGETGVHGLGALSLAARLIDSGEADAVMVVGVSPRPSVSALVPVDAEEPLAEKAFSGSGPFDVARQGTLIGQGAAALLLERADTANLRGAQILAWLDSCQVLTSTTRGQALDLAVRAVLSDCHSTPGLWLANAAGSPIGDREEFEVVTDYTSAPVTSTRGTIGTAFETAALIDVAIAVECLARRVAPPAGLVRTPDPALADLDVVTGEGRSLAPDTGVLLTAWNHGSSSGSAGAAFVSPFTGSSSRSEATS